MRFAILAALALPALVHAQSIEGKARCANGAGLTNVAVCVGETVTCTATFTNIDEQDWVVQSLTTTVKHPSGDEGGENLLFEPLGVAPDDHVDAAGVFVARAEDVPSVTVVIDVDATAETDGGKVLVKRVVDVVQCPVALRRAERHAYRRRSYRAICTNEGRLRVCRSQGETFTGTR